MSASGPEEPESARRRWEGVIRVQRPGPANTVRSAAHLDHEADEVAEEVPVMAQRAPAWAMAPAEWTVALPRFTAAHSVDCRLPAEPTSDAESEMAAPAQPAGPRADVAEPAAVVQHVEPEPTVQRDVEPEPATQQGPSADVPDAVVVAVVTLEAVESEVVEVAARVLAADGGAIAGHAAEVVEAAEAAEAAEAVKVIEAVEAEPAEPVRFVRRSATTPPAVARVVPVAATGPPQEARVPASRREADPLATSGGIGARLAQARKSAGLTHEQLARITRIGVGRLVEFENDDYSGCGAGVFARGRLDSIARAVGVDPQPLLQEFDTWHGRGGSNGSAEAVHRQLARVSRNWTTVLLVVLALAAVYPVALLVVAVLG